jgi:hypothetical protein
MVRIPVFFVFYRVLAAPAEAIQRCLLCRNAPIIVGEHPKPATIFPWSFEGNQFHLFPGVSDLSFGEPALCASLYDQSCWCGSVRQNIFQKDFWVLSPARLFNRPFGRWSPSTQPLENISSHDRHSS